MANIVIFGTGRGADIAHRYFSMDSSDRICAFTADAAHISDREFRGLPVVDFESVQDHYPPDSYQLFVPLGSKNMNSVRAQVYEACKQKGYTLASYVSSTIWGRGEFEVGENCFILQDNSINFDVKIGNNVTIWSANQIGDNTVIEDHCWITSHVCIAGYVRIGAFSFLGINCSISNGITIGERNFIGGNALISKATQANEVYVVNPTAKAAMSSERFSALMGNVF